MTLRERREEENKRAIGGLRNPQAAVASNHRLRLVGQRIRKVIEDHTREEEVDNMMEDIKNGASNEWVAEIRSGLCKEFEAVPVKKGFRVNLWEKILREAGGADSVCWWNVA